MNNMAKVESKATITRIVATSRASVKVRDSFYTVEYSEERTLPPDADIDAERLLLWDAVNTECDGQVEDILKTYK